MSINYRIKKESETWNEYLIKLFRECDGTNYCDFLDRYFKYENRLKDYQDGLAKELEKKSLSKSSSAEGVSDTISRCKVTFAKKPDRLKVKKGFLF